MAAALSYTQKQYDPFRYFPSDGTINKRITPPNTNGGAIRLPFMGFFYRNKKGEE
jgi:hypothetical protein